MLLYSTSEKDKLHIQCDLHLENFLTGVQKRALGRGVAKASSLVVEAWTVLSPWPAYRQLD